MRLLATQVMITPETTIGARLATLFSYMAFKVFESSFRPMSESGFLLENLLTQIGLLYRGQKTIKPARRQRCFCAFRASRGMRCRVMMIYPRSISAAQGRSPERGRAMGPK